MVLHNASFSCRLCQTIVDLKHWKNIFQKTKFNFSFRGGRNLWQPATQTLNFFKNYMQTMWETANKEKQFERNSGTQAPFWSKNLFSHYPSSISSSGRQDLPPLCNLLTRISTWPAANRVLCRRFKNNKKFEQANATAIRVCCKWTHPKARSDHMTRNA